MRVSKIEFKNILTFGGDIENSIELDDSGSLTQISGENGLGKSNIVRMLGIGLYYKYPSLVSKIINDLSSEGYIKIHVRSNGHNYVVENVFKSRKLHSIIVHKDSVLQDWGNISKASSLVLSEIATIPYSIFSNILSTSIDSQSSLLKLSAKDGRDIVNNVFDLSEVNIINDRHISPEFTLANTNHTKSINDIDATEKIIVSTNESIEEIKVLDEEINATKKETLKTSIENLNTEKGTLEIDVDADIKFIDSLNNEMKFSAYSKDTQTLWDLNEDLVNSKDELLEAEVKYDEMNTIESSRYMDKALETNKTNTTLLENLKIDLIAHTSQRDKFQEVVDARNKRTDDVREFAYFRERMMEVDANRKKLFEINPKLEANKSNIVGLEAKIEEINESIRKDNEIVDSLKIKLEFYKKGKCAICDVDFTADGYPEIIAGIEKNIADYALENKAYGTKRTDLNTQIKALQETNNKLIEEKTTIISTIKQTPKDLPKLVTDEIVLDFNSDIDLSIFDKYDWKDDLVKLANEIDEAQKGVDISNETISTTETSIKNIEKSITDLVFDTKVKYGLDMSTYVPVENISKLNDEEVALEKDKYAKAKAKIIKDIETQKVGIKVIETKWLDGVTQEMIDRHNLKKNLPLNIDDCEIKRTEKQGTLKISSDRLIIVISEIEKAEAELLELDGENDSEHISVLKATLERTNKTLATQKNASNVTKNEMESMQFLKQMYNSGGLKNALVGKVIGSLNMKINTITDKYNIPVSVSYDPEFLPSFTKFGHEVLYDQLSVGQRKMLELITIISVVDYYKRGYPSINMVNFDETLSSLSDKNSYIVMCMIKEYLVNDLGLNVFIVNHSHVSGGVLDCKIELQEKNGYTIIKKSQDIT
jgi:hypothetical protein